jgi:hypothetical protein
LEYKASVCYIDHSLASHSSGCQILIITSAHYSLLSGQIFLLINAQMSLGLGIFSIMVSARFYVVLVNQQQVLIIISFVLTSIAVYTLIFLLSFKETFGLVSMAATFTFKVRLLRGCSRTQLCLQNRTLLLHEF